MFKNSLTSNGKTSSKIQFKKGDLVKLNINKVVSPESLTLCYTRLDFVTLFEKIDLYTYPSYKDFKGKTVEQIYEGLRNGTIKLNKDKLSVIFYRRTNTN